MSATKLHISPGIAKFLRTFFHFFATFRHRAVQEGRIPGKCGRVLPGSRRKPGGGKSGAAGRPRVGPTLERFCRFFKSVRTREHDTRTPKFYLLILIIKVCRGLCRGLCGGLCRWRVGNVGGQGVSLCRWPCRWPCRWLCRWRAVGGPFGRQPGGRSGWRAGGFGGWHSRQPARAGWRAGALAGSAPSARAGDVRGGGWAAGRPPGAWGAAHGRGDLRACGPAPSASSASAAVRPCSGVGSACRRPRQAAPLRG